MNFSGFYFFIAVLKLKDLLLNEMVECFKNVSGQLYSFKFNIVLTCKC